jgi:fatty-acyl-CoA synthase
MKTPQQDEQCRQMYETLLPNIADYVALYAKERPKETAIIEHNTGETVTWKQFDTSVSAFAAKLLSIGLVKGDIVATSLPLLKEHVYLMYACYRIGVIIAPARPAPEGQGAHRLHGEDEAEGLLLPGQDAGR